MAPHVLLELGRRLELLSTRLTGVDLDPRQLLAVLLQVGRELALKDELIAALAANQVLQEDQRVIGLGRWAAAAKWYR